MASDDSDGSDGGWTSVPFGVGVQSGLYRTVVGRRRRLASDDSDGSDGGWTSVPFGVGVQSGLYRTVVGRRRRLASDDSDGGWTSAPFSESSRVCIGFHVGLWRRTRMATRNLGWLTRMTYSHCARLTYMADLDGGWLTYW
jgi:hypothetical protein